MFLLKKHEIISLKNLEAHQENIHNWLQVLEDQVLN